MKVHILVETEESFSEPLSVSVVGSYKSLYLARNALVNRIIERAQKDRELASALWQDANHGEELREAINGDTGLDAEHCFCRDEEEHEYLDRVRKALRRYLMSCVVGDDAYYVHVLDWRDKTVHFDIFESELEV